MSLCVYISSPEPSLFRLARGSLMKPEWQKKASVAQEICTL